jgi:hypothetical protein
MLYINKLTNDAQQQITLTGIPNVQIAMSLRFMPRTAQWIMGLQYQDFELEGLAIVASLNMLRQWKNILPFGISCLRADGLDPYQITDFQNKIANLYLLDAADVTTIEEDWF